MKLKHWAILAFALIGVVFVAHNYMSHGGVAGVKQGLGLSV